MSDARHKARASGAAVRSDTIVAIGTAAGRSAIGIVRLSGPGAEEIGRRVVAPWPTRPRRLTRCTVRDPRTGDPIDEGLAAVFPAPASYTGETVLEVHSHGGRYVPAAIEAAFAAAGARPALPGEFTERALLRGKLDLIQAEAVRELIDARTRAAHNAAIEALSGHLAQQYASLREAAIGLEALLAFDIDFPEEDHGPLARERVTQAAEALRMRLHAAAASAPAQARARDGATVVLAGPPNAGKSSLLNALVGEMRAIVSDEPGTTRDAIEVFVDGDPWPLRYVDTAGLRDDAGLVERLGIAVSERYLRAADVVVVCDERERISDGAVVRGRIRELTRAEIVVARTKVDLRRVDDAVPGGEAVAVSSVTGEGIPELRQRIMDAVSAQAGGTPRPDAAITARQQAALESARAEIDAFIAAWHAGELPTPVAATHLRAAVAALEDLVGAIDADEVLARVFSTFCVGK
ncbi:MAG TPA: tRNA modification GTPase [Gemmatimonadaceae bacterium]|nr:tRNA modification GTPase [Gemmatimonadaceae bacterium]